METYSYSTIVKSAPCTDSLLTKLRRVHQNLPQKVALIEENRQVTYSGLWERVDKYTYFFQKQGLEKGQVVVIVCPMTSIEVVCILLALMQAGLVPFIINLADKFQRLQPEDVQAAGLIIHRDIQKYLNQTNQEAFSPEDLIENDLLWFRRQDRASALHTNASLLVTSSGSTNRKKIIRYGTKGMVFNIEKNIKALDIRSNDRTLMILPLTYSYGLIAQFFSHLRVGATIVFSNKRMITNAIIELVNRYEITSVFTVPPIFRQLVFMVEKFGKIYRKRYRWDSLRYFTVGGNHIETSTIQKGLRLFGCPIVKTYGLAEAGPRVATHWVKAESDPINRNGAILEGMSVKVLGADGKSLESGQSGLLKIYTPSAALGYLFDNPNNLSIKGHWVYTNDYGSVSPEGQLTLAGRKEHAFQIKGVNRPIFKNDIADLLHSKFYLMKLQIQQKTENKIQIDIAAMPGCKPTPELVIEQLKEEFGGGIESGIEIAFPRIGTIKIDK